VPLLVFPVLLVLVSSSRRVLILVLDLLVFSSFDVRCSVFAVRCSLL